jgi:uncharacterized protein (TIGR02145 family)
MGIFTISCFTKTNRRFNMNTITRKGVFNTPLLAATLVFALALTISCSNDHDDDSKNCTNAVTGSNTVTCGGQTYRTTKIGTQTWMAENLNYDVKGSRCYDDDPENCAIYGRLYDWSMAMGIDKKYNSQEWNGRDAKHRGICPSGWHIPSNADLDKLMRYVDGTSGSESPYNSPTAGRYLKATSGWKEDGNGEDTHGFSALPGGFGYSGGRFGDIGGFGAWWSSSEIVSVLAYDRYMSYGSEDAFYSPVNNKDDLRSVRCVKD